MTSQRIKLPQKLAPIFEGEADYRGAWGGRGSGKTTSFAKMAAAFGVKFAQEDMPGVIVCAREYMNSLDDSSLAEVKAAIASEPWLASHYEVGEKFIRTVDGRISFVFVGLRQNIASIKSKSKIRLLWVDEAEPVSAYAWQVAIPTVREEGAEIWVTWNPERKNSATHMRFREDPPSRSKFVELNWRDNPWFGEGLNRKRIEDKTKRPDQYAHIWNGDFVSAMEGAYFARHLAEARKEGRIGKVARDPLMSIRAYWDIGGTGAKADATAIWICQFVNREIRVLDYYEAQGQDLATHLAWLRDRGWGKKPTKAECFLPHDGVQGDKVFAVSFESGIRAAGFDVQVIPNMGRGAARNRIEAARRVFPSIWINEETCQAGIDAIGWYHEKRSEDERNVGLGPDHDWSSHAADAWGMMCMAYDPPDTPAAQNRYAKRRSGQRTSHMAA